jgi:hypothetical protein
MRDVLDLPALADAGPAGIEALFRLLIEPPPAKKA